MSEDCFSTVMTSESECVLEKVVRAKGAGQERRALDGCFVQGGRGANATSRVGAKVCGRCFCADSALCFPPP